jgi:S1-C subfamily serine protease
VVAIGNAGGRGGTPSFAAGSVTALDHSITASNEADGTSEQLTGLVETNADIQPGDSGGPLVNAQGKVIGMDSAASAGISFAQGGSALSQGFSIPINTAVKIAHEITSGASSSTVHIGPTAFLGVGISPQGLGGGFGGFGQPPSSLTPSGAEIGSVTSGSPAALAHLAPGDTIVSLGGRSVASPSALTNIIITEKPGVTEKLSYFDSSGGTHTVSVRLVAGPPQ